MTRFRFTCRSFRIFIMVSLMLLSACPAAVRGEYEVTMVWEQWEPFYYKDANENVTGLDIEIISKVLERMGCRLALREIPWKRFLEEMKSGVVQLGAGVSKTEEREQFVYFSDPYRQESFKLFIRKGEKDKFEIKNLGDLPKLGFRLGMVGGYYHGGGTHVF